MPARLASPLSALQPHYEVVVIGSGYGGGITASRLARAGRKVAVLERGRELHPGEYPDTLPEFIREFQLSAPGVDHLGSRTALFDLHVNREINVFVGCGLGGTSLINGNVAIRPEPRVFDDARWPKALRDDLLGGIKAGFERAERMLRPAPYPRQRSPLAKLNALEKSAKAIGAELALPPLNVTFDPLPDGKNASGIEQVPCRLCGDCVTGCNHGAKNTVLMNYLPDARAFGAELFCEVGVRWLERGAQGGWRVHYQPLRTGREKFDHAPPMFVSADVVVLAAGTLGSTELLLRSRERGLGLPPSLGQRFTGNGDVLAFSYNSDDPIQGVGWGARTVEERHGVGAVGPSIAGMIDLRERATLEDGMVIEEGAIPGALASLVPAIFATASRVVGTPTGSTAPAEIREERARELESVVGGAYRGALQSSQTYLVMTHDDGNGVVSLAPGSNRVEVSWPGVGDQPIFDRVRENLIGATRPLEGTFVKNPISSKLLGNDLITVHPLGGCAMGEDASTGVVNHKGQVFAGAEGTAVYEGLYVNDGAVLPLPLGVNPLLTISAVAERNAQLIATDRGWTVDESARPLVLPPSPPPVKGLRFTEKMTGYFSTAETGDFLAAEERGKADGSTIAFELCGMAEDAEALIANLSLPIPMMGTVEAPALSPRPLFAGEGELRLLVRSDDQVDTYNMFYRQRLTAVDGKSYFFEAFKVIHDDPGPDLWSDTTTLYVTVRAGAADGPVVGKGVLRMAVADFMRQVASIEVTNAADAGERLATAARFGKKFVGDLYDLYGGILQPSSALVKNAPPRKPRPLRAPSPDLHLIETSDDVVIRLARYRGGEKGPVLLAHGLGVSGRIFTLDTVETNLVEHLCAHGYDVWNLEHRASTELPSSATAFTGDDVARIDWPAAVAKVIAVTGKPSVQVVAHCFGATTFLMAQLAGLKGVRSAVCSQVGTHVEVPLLTALKSGLHVPEVLDALGVPSLTAYAGPNPSWLDGLFDHALALQPTASGEGCDSAVCHRIQFLYGALWDHRNLNDLTHRSLHELFGVASIQAFEHLARITRAGHLVSARGAEAYLPHPENLRLPIAFLHGAGNRCFLPEGTRKTQDWLAQRNGELYSRQVVQGYGHLDCIVGQRASEDVFPHIVSHLEATQDELLVKQWVLAAKPPAAIPRPAQGPDDLEPSPPSTGEPVPAIPEAAMRPLRAIYRAGALVNFAATLPAFFAYDAYLRLFQLPPPEHPFLIWIWSGMAFLWGVLFWELANDLPARQSLLKYTWLEKGVTAVSVTVAYLDHRVPWPVLAGIALTDIVWIPLFLGVQWRLAALGEEAQAPRLAPRA